MWMSYYQLTLVVTLRWATTISNHEGTIIEPSLFVGIE